MFALCLIDRGASVHSFKVIKLRKMKDIINKILNYSLLAAKNVLTLEDVSLLTGLSKSHLYKLTCNHQIPHYKPKGKQLYFDRAEIEAWMKQGKVSTVDESEQMAALYLAKTSKKGR